MLAIVTMWPFFCSSMPGRNSLIKTKCETRLTLNILSKNIEGVSRTVLPEPDSSGLASEALRFPSLSRSVGSVCLVWIDAVTNSERNTEDGKMLVLTDSSIVDENGRIAMCLANCAAEVDEVGEVRNIAFIVVDFWHWEV